MDFSEKMTRVSAELGVSPEELARELEESRRIEPDYAARHSWEAYSKSLITEYTQCAEEGLDIGAYRDVMAAVQRLPDGRTKEAMADALFGAVSAAGTAEGYPYIEPSDPEGIRACRRERAFAARVTEEREMEDRLRGAWTGRIAGCLLGKTVEGMRTDELVPLLKETGNYPMHRYIRKSEMTEEIYNKYRFRLRGRCFADAVPCAPVDDDTNYTVMAQKLVERYGRDFTPADVGRSWLDWQPKCAYCTAERVAYVNLVNGFAPPKTAVYKNPFREWIGAQIRTDYYGYINPGDPEAAAEMAWRDASVSHIKNGIYGAMWAAAVIACAASTDSLRSAVLGGLGQIPEKSRFYERVSGIVAMYDRGSTREECFEHIHSLYDEHTAHGWCHTIPNAMIVTAALLYGGGDYGRSVCMAVQTGFDTDCNGATVGSVLGMMYGAAAIPEEWSAPLNGKLETSIFGVGTVTIDGLVEKTLKHLKK